MATRMGIRELRDGLAAAVRRAQQGETIEVTHHGEPVALLTPVPADRLARLIALGEVSEPTESEWPKGGHPVTGPMTASEALEEDRADR